MDVRWDSKSGTEASPRVAILVADRSDWSLFDTVARHLATALEGRWIAQFDGLDQRYWDLECDDGVITLHLEHYLGIYVFDDSRSAAAAVPSRLLTRAFEALVAFEPRS
jgi:hypothetical protein